jgi:hypothetical protein
MIYIFALILEFYEILFPIFLIVIYYLFKIKCTNYEPLSLLALSSLLANYYFVEYSSRFHQFPPDLPASARGDSEFLCIAGLIISIVISIISLRRIRVSEKKGKVLSIIILTLCSTVILGILLFILWLFWALSGM